MTIFSGQTYLEKHRFCPQQIKKPPKVGLEMVVVIPCHGEEGLIQTLSSLENCLPPQGDIEVIVVLNASENASASLQTINQKTRDDFNNWNKQVHSLAHYFLLEFPSLPKKHAGVGLARKIGMDEAVGRFERAGKEDGIIICLDADSTVREDYFQQIQEHFSDHPLIEACSLHFEHPLSGDQFEPDVYRGIIYYELFLRYYVEALRYAGHPYAYHTIGSSMAVRSSGYQRQNGMNRRKAGEDFYFLMKFIVDGKLNELKTTCVYPSPRPADHVPFGTGKAILTWLAGKRIKYPAYDFRTFEDLHQFLRIVPDLYEQDAPELPLSISSFLDSLQFSDALVEIRKHVTSQSAFVKRFYKWFNGLQVLKFVHYARDHHYPDQEIVTQSHILHQKLSNQPEEMPSAQALLLAYRNRQKAP